MWEPFAGAGCSGLVACLEAGLTVKDYIWQDTCPRAMAVAGTLPPKLMRRFPGQLSAAAIRGFTSKLPSDIRLTGANLGQPGADRRGGWGLGMSIHVEGWQEEEHGGQEGILLFRPRALPELPLGATSPPSRLHSQKHLSRERVRCAHSPRRERQIQEFVGAPAVIDAVSVEGREHRLRSIWTNILPAAFFEGCVNRDPQPPPLQDLTDEYHQPSPVYHDEQHPFCKLNVRGQPRRVLPTILSYPRSHAFRARQDGRPGVGQLWIC